jgi:hypothetical protein
MKTMHNEGRLESESLLVLVKKLLVLAAVGLRLGRKIYAKQEEIADSIEILARQKARDLNPEKPADSEAK